MRLRDMVQMEKSDLGEFVEVDAELSVRCTVTAPNPKLQNPNYDPFEEAESRALKVIDEAIFGKTRNAFDVFVDVVISNSNPRRRDPELMAEIEKAYEHMRQTLSIYGER